VDKIGARKEGGGSEAGRQGGKKAVRETGGKKGREGALVRKCMGPLVSRLYQSIIRLT
jgi:hypothetical protein